jgi:ketosteroid isomerase-like protein
MKTTNLLHILFIALMLCSTASFGNNIPNQPAAHSHNHLDAELNELFAQSVRLFNSKDLDGLVNRFVSDGSLKLPNNELVEGHEGLRNFYTGTLQLENFNIELQPFKIQISEGGDMAWALANFKVSFDTPGGPFNDAGVSLLVFKREDGQWKIAAENLSSGPAQ